MATQVVNRSWTIAQLPAEKKHTSACELMSKICVTLPLLAGNFW